LGNKDKENSNNLKGIAFIFPGQGSQYINMGKEFLDVNSKYKEYFEISSKIVDRDIIKIINGEDKSSSLEDTRFSQISIYSLSCALNDYITGDLPVSKKYIKMVAGHSLGEYSALYSSGAYNYEQGARLVGFRGKIMSKADKSAKGMMAAVLGADIGIIADTLSNYKDKVFIANHNDYAQVVISGYENDVKRAILDLNKNGAKKIIPLKVNIASHCPLMKEVSDSLEKFIEENINFEDMELPFFSATEVAYKDKDDIKKTLTGQLINPIRWVDSIEYLLNQNIKIFIEIGPGKVLSGLIGRIARKNSKDVIILNTNKMEDIKKLIDTLKKEGIIYEA